jgi:COP9 signalosome complex subunit 8
MLNLFASVWERRYEHVYSRGEALFVLARQGDFPHAEMAGVLAALVTACIGECSLGNTSALIYYFFTESFRQRTIVLLSNAYTAIPLALAQIYIGLPADKLLSSMSY